MTPPTVTPPTRRALAAAAAAILLLVAVARTVPIWRGWSAEAQARAMELMAQAARRDAVMDGLARSLDSLEARTARLTRLKPALLFGDSPAAAASSFAALVAEAARVASVRLDAVDARVDSSASRVIPRVILDLQATADVHGLAALLRDLEDGPTLVAVRRLTIRPQRVSAPRDEVETLTLRLTAEALALVRQAAKEP